MNTFSGQVFSIPPVNHSQTAERPSPAADKNIGQQLNIHRVHTDRHLHARLLRTNHHVQ